MIKELRTKFVILSTISLLLLLGIIVVSSSLLTYRELMGKADMILDMLAENGGRPAHLQSLDKKVSAKPGKKHFSPEMMYEARFFTADISADGQVIGVNTKSIAMIDDTQAGDYARTAYSRKSGRGFIGAFRYVKIDKNSDTHVIFLDCGRDIDMFKHSVLINCLISFAGLLVSFVIILIFSKRLVKPVSDSYEKQKQFISVAGHELKTPLTIIDADAEILSMEIGEENEWLQDICRQTKRMTALTNDLLALSRMDENKQPFTMIDFPISDVVEEAVSSFQALARSKGRDIRTEITPMLSYCGDENGIRQLVGILLDNAIKYAKEDDILIKLEKRSHSICLMVRNSAEPVSDEQLGRFFERFYRIEKSREADSGGYGLGLAIAKSIVEAHKGRITATALDTGCVQMEVVMPMKEALVKAFL